MSDRPIDNSLRALREVHEVLWDPRAALVRLAPGVNPGVDVSAFNLHAVRETALGAVLDLQSGNADRAATAIREVLANQYREEGLPWSGTFKVCAEEARPPTEGAEEWFHYDPNWRQFLGCILAYTLERHAESLPAGHSSAMEEAIGRCVRGEPTARIPAWYTNPNLMHAWLTAWLGVRSGDRGLIVEGEARLRQIMGRFERDGDVDEYNSPTYDGIDLFAAALWSSLPPTPMFENAGVDLATTIGARLGRLYHPALGAICGPYNRAYGLSLDRYVSLAGQWLALAGGDASRVLPSPLDENTVHIHDLYFLPIFDDLANAVVGHIDIQEVDGPRRHEQSFGDVVAVSYLDTSCAIGAERGRVPTFAKDQYVPFTAHFFDGPAVESVGVKLSEIVSAVDAYVDYAGVDGEWSATLTARSAGASVDLALIFSTAPAINGTNVSVGPLSLEFSAVPVGVTIQSQATATHVLLSWNLHEVVMSARLA
jgi:hypothetical protein